MVITGKNTEEQQEVRIPEAEKERERKKKT